jgi:hypothetical protein
VTLVDDFLKRVNVRDAYTHVRPFLHITRYVPLEDIIYQVSSYNEDEIHGFDVLVDREAQQG